MVSARSPTTEYDSSKSQSGIWAVWMAHCLSSDSLICRLGRRPVKMAMTMSLSGSGAWLK